MTKKAAKKKEAGKKAATKATRPRAGKEEGQEENKSPSETAPEAAPRAEDQKHTERSIEVVEEKAPREGSEAPRKIGRVPRPDGGKRTDSSRSPRSGSARRGNRRGSGGGGGHRPSVDSDELGRKAWKVFQHEIAEEGLALIDENSARQLAEKSLVVTRAFLEERERRLGKSNAPEEKSGPGASEEATPPAEEATPAKEAPANEAPEKETPAAEAPVASE